MSQVSLLTVTHDPKGNNIELFKQLQQEIEQIYEELYIAISEESSIELIKVTEKSPFKVKVIPKKGAAQARREVLKFGLTSRIPYYHYCDFDRLLTWIKSHLDEIREIVTTMSEYDYLILGRTERAMNTHPSEWILTERVTNAICSLQLGKEVDITAGSCSFSRRSADYIDSHSKEKMTDAEWAMIIHRIAKLNVHYKPVEGLEYNEEINGIQTTMSDTEKWLTRLRLSSTIIETAIKTGK